jgi:hypothetical protein
MGTEGPFAGGKVWPGRDADHSPPSSAKVKNEQELYLLSPHAPSWRVAGSLYLFLYCFLRDLRLIGVSLRVSFLINSCIVVLLNNSRDWLWRTLRLNRWRFERDLTFSVCYGVWLGQGFPTFFEWRHTWQNLRDSVTPHSRWEPHPHLPLD